MKCSVLYKILIVSMVTLLTSHTLLSENIYNGDLTLSTQAQVNAFNYTEITGNLTIQGSDITDLTPLNSLTSVGGRLRIYSNTSLTSLSGLKNITSVGGSLVIVSNPALTSLSGLDNITFVAGSLGIQFNDVLTSLSGLDNITSVPGDLWIDSNPALTSLSGLGKLTSVDSWLYITNNWALTGLSGLNNLSFVGGELNILSNTSLTSFCGLYPLLSAGGLAGAYNVSDNALNPTRLEIIDGGPCINNPPTAFCQGIIIQADENCEAIANAEDIDNGSTDPDGDEITLKISPEGPYPLGETSVVLTVTDDKGASGECTAVITVVDITPPAISAVPEPFLLKQNNHKYVTFTMDDFNVVTDDNCSVSGVFISKATSDEPEDDFADGSTLNDIVISDDCQSVMVRKERAGTGNGRVYTVELMVTDGSGNIATTYAYILVPHNSYAEVIDDGPVYQVTGDCNMPAEMAEGKSASISVNGEEIQPGEPALNVYPNPTTGKLMIDGLDELTNPKIKIFDMTGRCMHNLSGSSSIRELDLTKYPSGLYNVKIYDSKGVSNFKVFKK